MGLGVFSNVRLPKLKLPTDFDYDAKNDLISGLKNSLKGAKKQFDFSPVKDVAKKNAEGISFSKIGEKFKSTYESSGVSNVISNSFPDMQFTELKQGVQAMKSLKEDDSITTKNPNEILNLSNTILGGTYEMKTSISSDEVQSDPAKYAGGTLPVVKKPTSGESVFKLEPDVNKEIENQTNIFGPKKDKFTGYLYDSLVTSVSSGGSTEDSAASEVNDILDGIAATGDAGSSEAETIKKGISDLSYDQKKALSKMDRDKLVKKLGIKDWESYFYSSDYSNSYTPEEAKVEMGGNVPISNASIAENPSDYVTYHGRVIKKTYLKKGTWWVLDSLQHPFDHIADLMGDEGLKKFGAMSDRLSNGVQVMRGMSLNNTGFNLESVHSYDLVSGGEGKFLEQQKSMATSDYISNDAKQIFKQNTGTSVDPTAKGGLLSLLDPNGDATAILMTNDTSSFNNIMGDMTSMFNRGREDEITMGSMGLDFGGINYRDMQETRSEPSYLKNVAYETKMEEGIRNGTMFNFQDSKVHAKLSGRIDTLNKGIDNPFNVDKEIKETDSIIDRIIKQIV